MPTYACDLAAVREAADRIRGIVHRTPVMTCATLDQLAGKRLFVKYENLQKVGPFKYRGAAGQVEGERERDVGAPERGRQPLAREGTRRTDVLRIAVRLFFEHLWSDVPRRG